MPRFDGTAGDDTIQGSDEWDYIYGYPMYGLISGNDRLFGNGGDDQIWGGDGDDLLDGGAGSDTVYNDSGRDTLVGGDGVDTFDMSRSYGTQGVVMNLVNGIIANDGFGFSETITGFEKFHLSGRADAVRADTIVGTDANESFYNVAVGDIVEAGGGNDYFAITSGPARVDGGAGVDFLFIDSYSQEFLYGYTGTDRLSQAVIDLAAGTISYHGRNGVILGFESAAGGLGSDILRGDAGANGLDGGDGDDLIEGAAGNDTLSDSRGSDTLLGGDGDDRITTFEHGGEDTGGDTVDGGRGFDTIRTGRSDDVLRDNPFNDQGLLIAYAGEINGGGGYDRLTIDGLEIASIQVMGSAGIIWLPGDGVIPASPSQTLRINFVQADRTGTLYVTNVEEVNGHAVLAGALFSSGADNVDFTSLTPAQAGVVATADLYNALAGEDVVRLPNGSVQITSGVSWNPSNFFDAGAGSDTVYGGSGADRIRGGTGGDTIHAGAGDDQIEDDARRDDGIVPLGAGTIDGGPGYDKLTLTGGTVTAVFLGTEQIWWPDDGYIPALPDWALSVHIGGGIVSVTNVEEINGLKVLRPLFTTGEDTVDFDNLTEAQQTVMPLFKIEYGANWNDANGGRDIIKLPSSYAISPTNWTIFQDILGGAGDDEITGRGLGDVIRGGADNDTLIGGGGEDTLFGDGGNDRLFGFESQGSQERDDLTGGAGDDDFFVGNRDHVLDFGAGDELILRTPAPVSRTLILFDGSTTEIRAYGADRVYEAAWLDSGVRARSLAAERFDVDGVTGVIVRNVDPTSDPFRFVVDSAEIRRLVFAQTIQDLETQEQVMQGIAQVLEEVIGDRIEDASVATLRKILADDSAEEAIQLFASRFAQDVDMAIDVRSAIEDLATAIDTNAKGGFATAGERIAAFTLPFVNLIIPGAKIAYMVGSGILAPIWTEMMLRIHDRLMTLKEDFESGDFRDFSERPDFLIIEGDQLIYRGGDGADRFLNLGTIRSNAPPPGAHGIAMSAPAAALGDQQIDGGDGFDTLIIQSAAPVVVDMAAGTVSGAEIGIDSLVSIEAVVAGSGADTLKGSAGNDDLSGADGNDQFFLQQGGDDLARGDNGNEGFYFGAAFAPGDFVDGGAGVDTVVLQGNYAGATFGDLRNVEVLLLASGGDTRFGDTSGSSYGYNLINKDPNIASRAVFTVQANGLGTGENLAYDGSDEVDGQLRIFSGRGTDALKGGGGRDGFFFGPDGNLTGADRIDGGANTDSVALRGNYIGATAVVLQDASLVGIEVITFLSGHTREFGGFLDTNGFDYDVTLADGNIAAGARLDIIATNLRANENVRLDGRAELDGTLRILSGAGDDQLYGGAGADTLFGGLGADRLEGGAGADIYLFRATGESTAAARDTVHGFASGDKIDLAAIDAVAGTAATNEAFTFIGGSAFSGVAGQLRAFASGADTVIEADTNGDSVADLSILVVAAPIAAADLVL